jgi:arylsulfatase A-like enzyme
MICRFGKVLRVGLLCLLAFLGLRPAILSAADRPNVVLIISDDQGWTDYGFMGHKEVETPNLDKLAKRSLLFTRGYVTSPLCRPSLATMATGLYPHQHGVTGNDVNAGVERAKLDLPIRKGFYQHANLIQSLVAGGYVAHQSGKWWEGSWQDGGFTAGMTHGDPKRGGRHGDVGLKIGRSGLKPITDFIDQAVEAEKPFFVWYAPFLPHTPHNPPERLLKKYETPGRATDVAKYYAMCEWFDQTCGELLEYINRKDQTANTLVLYICDNGWAPRSTNLDDPAQKQWGSFALRSKGSPFEMGIRTPIMISWPGHIEAKKSEDLAQSIDLFPTIAAACGVEAPKKLPGINLLDEKARADREVVFGAMHSIHNMTVGNPDDTLQYRYCIDGDWKLLVRYDGTDTTGYKRVHAWDQEPVRLYHLAEDPHEQSNVADSHPARVAEMKARLNKSFPAEKENEIAP